MSRTGFYFVNFDKSEIEIDHFDDRKIVVTGIAKLLHQEGLYSLLGFISKLIKAGQTVSWLNCTRELLRYGWKDKAILSTYREINSFQPNQINLETISRFLSSNYEEQNSMLFEFYFNSGRSEAVLFLESIFC